VTTVRYLDDFLILAPSGAKAEKAWKSAERVLRDLGLEAHDPSGSSGKAGRGEIAAGFDFLSFHVNGSGIAPSRGAKAEFLDDVKSCVRAAKRELLADQGDPRRAQGRFVQSLDLLDCKIRGWGDAFREADQRLAFAQLDRELDVLVQDYVRWFLSKVDRHSPAAQRRMWGIALLGDTPPPKMEPLA
jgi:hypothetical protein